MNGYKEIYRCPNCGWMTYLIIKTDARSIVPTACQVFICTWITVRGTGNPTVTDVWPHRRVGKEKWGMGNHSSFRKPGNFTDGYQKYDHFHGRVVRESCAVFGRFRHLVFSSNHVYNNKKLYFSGVWKNKSG